MVESNGICPEALLVRATRGNEEALAELMRTYRPDLALLACLQIERQLQAEIGQSDLVQQTTLLAHRGFHSFRRTTEPEFASWLRTTLAHIAADTARPLHATATRCARRAAGATSLVPRELTQLGKGKASTQTTANARLWRQEESHELAQA